MKSPMLTLARTTGTALLLAAAMLLGACASSQPAPAPTASATTEASTSAKYQQAINDHAKKKNVHVHWVHPPDDDDLEKDDG